MMNALNILIASNNAHKHQEFSEIFTLFGAAHVKLFTPKQLGLYLDPDETGSTYEANARIKSDGFVALLSTSQAPPDVTIDFVMSDDSGLEVDALEGRPGLHSARYHKAAPKGDGCTALLDEMLHVPAHLRAARFRAMLVLAKLDGSSQLFEGVCQGSIGYEKRGEHGFGFDPIFMVDFTRTMAELSAIEKHRISHRGLAGQQVVKAVSN